MAFQARDHDVFHSGEFGSASVSKGQVDLQNGRSASSPNTGSLQRPYFKHTLDF